MNTDYDKLAEDFLKKTDTKLDIVFIRNGIHFEGDTDKRDIYNVTLSRNNRVYDFKFGNSIADSQYYLDKHIRNRKYDCNGWNENYTKRYNTEDITKYPNRFCILVKGKKPSAYSILACLQKYDVGTLEDFCSNYGYDTDSKKAEKIYRAVLNEYTQLCTLFNEKEMEELAEIN